MLILLQAAKLADIHVKFGWIVVANCRPCVCHWVCTVQIACLFLLIESSVQWYHTRWYKCSDGGWQVEERAKYGQVFETLRPVDGRLHGDKVRPVSWAVDLTVVDKCRTCFLEFSVWLRYLWVWWEMISCDYDDDDVCIRCWWTPSCQSMCWVVFGNWVTSTTMAFWTAMNSFWFELVVLCKQLCVVYFLLFLLTHIIMVKVTVCCAWLASWHRLSSVVCVRIVSIEALRLLSLTDGRVCLCPV